MDKIIIDAFITARGGSKGLPRKNVLPMNGVPLVAHSIAAAKECPLIRNCWVSTEDEEISLVSKSHGAEVISRPPELSGDTAMSSDVVLHMIEYLETIKILPDYFVLLQPTSPLRTHIHVKECIEGFLNSDYKSAVSVTEIEHHPHKCFYFNNDELNPLFGYEYLDKPRQLLPKVFRQNGAIYIVGIENFKKNKRFVIPKIYPYIMSNELSIDIDTYSDFKSAEQLLMLKKKVEEN